MPAVGSRSGAIQNVPVGSKWASKPPTEEPLELPELLELLRW